MQDVYHGEGSRMSDRSGGDDVDIVGEAGGDVVINTAF